MATRRRTRRKPRRRKRSGGQGVGIALVALGMAAFLGLFGWQQVRTAGSGPPRIAPLMEVLDPVRDNKNKDLCERLLHYAQTAEFNDMLEARDVRAIDKAVRDAAEDGKISNDEVITVGNAVSQGATGVPVKSRFDIEQILGQ